jgi:hypothetical protein
VLAEAQTIDVKMVVFGVDVRMPMVVSISHRSEELRFYGLV